jgi:aspartyl-tRNA(Asn)/glutamyl-tRNA(Gln) amidotransferase subunit A
MERYSDLKHIQADIAAGKTSCIQQVDYYLQQIEKTLGLNIYVEVFAEEAIKRAMALDKKFRQNPESVGKLHGAVLSLKDVICYADHEVSAASTILKGFKAQYSATAVERLLAEDAIFIGRTNCDQFAMGSDNTNSIYGAVRNAADPTRVAGGSSGGAAVSVQAHTCLMALGSDTGGSVRQPAAFCGVFGLKPTYGRISRHGLLAYGSSFDQIGVLANSVSDAALALEVMAGADDFDATASQQPVEAYSQMLAPKKNYKIAYFAEALNSPGLDPEIREKTWATIAQLQALGHVVEATEFRFLNYIVPTYYVLTTAEASSNLSRYDGIRFGYRAEGTKSLKDTYRKSRTEGFSAEIKRRILLGTFVLSSGYYDAYYTKAQKVRRLIAERTQAIFANYDFILMPSTPTVAWRIGEKSSDPVAMYLADIFTVQANMVGVPAVSLPLSKNAEEMPIGIQFLADKHQDAALLTFSDYFLKNCVNS